MKRHFAQCNNANCNTFFFVETVEEPDDFGLLCPECRGKTLTSHVVQCSSCKTIINFVAKLESEEAVVFVLDKCSHCYGSLEDEREIEPLYQSDSYI